MLRKIVLFMIMSIILLLSACSKDEGTSSGSGSTEDGEAVNKYGAIDHGVDENKVGFNMTGDAIEEATGISAEAKEQILAAFTIYIDTFNKKDIDSYIDTLSDSTESFDKVEERTYMEEVFNAYDLDRRASDVTIVKYSESEAQVFANLNTSMKQLSSGLETNPSGRQVTVFTKDDGEWKVSAVHYLGDEVKK